jgi:hypothetical protein
MTTFWKPNQLIQELLADYDEENTPTELKKLLGVEKLHIQLHQREGDIVLEAPNGVKLFNCELIPNPLPE